MALWDHCIVGRRVVWWKKSSRKNIISTAKVKQQLPTKAKINFPSFFSLSLMLFKNKQYPLALEFMRCCGFLTHNSLTRCFTCSQTLIFEPLLLLQFQLNSEQRALLSLSFHTLRHHCARDVFGGLFTRLRYKTVLLLHAFCQFSETRLRARKEDLLSAKK